MKSSMKISGKRRIQEQFWLPHECVTSCGGVVEVLLLLRCCCCCCCCGGVVVVVVVVVVVGICVNILLFSTHRGGMSKS